MFEQRALDALRPEFNTAPHAYSALGMKHTPETKAKLSAGKMGNTHTLGYKHRPESIEKMRASHLGVSSPTKGKKRDPAAVAATAAAHRGMKRSKETCEKIAAKAKGRVFPPRSAEYRAKVSARFKGRKLSPEHLAAFVAGRRAQVITEDMRQAMSERVRHQYETGLRSRIKTAETRNKLSKAFSKLSEQDVREIKRLRADGVTGKSLSKKYGIAASSISQIVRGLRYRWVDNP